METLLDTSGGRSLDLGRRDQVLFNLNSSGEWLVLHIKSRQEKALAEQLESLSIPHFLPLQFEQKIHGGRKAIVASPLFPGYLFLRGTIHDAYRADRTRRVANIIPVKDQVGLNQELLNVHLALSEGVRLKAHHCLRQGIKVEVIAGPLCGLQGLIENIGTRNRVILQVNMLGSAVSVEVDADCVEPMH